MCFNALSSSSISTSIDSGLETILFKVLRWSKISVYPHSCINCGIAPSTTTDLRSEHLWLVLPTRKVGSSIKILYVKLHSARIRHNNCTQTVNCALGRFSEKRGRSHRTCINTKSFLNQNLPKQHFPVLPPSSASSQYHTTSFMM
jgi:hypothetical protein